MHWTWSDLFAILTIIAGWIGFTFASPGNVQNISQASFYIFSVVYLVLLFRRFRHKKPNEPAGA